MDPICCCEIKRQKIHLSGRMKLEAEPTTMGRRWVEVVVVEFVWSFVKFVETGRGELDGGTLYKLELGCLYV